ncbi:flagellar filament capping protein FliD [Burkholderia vietnamiensis]|uniref:Flagellar hook-associated protein 2 n=1 Tax=Burkholderia vietnamiensis (strain G4 / LMG 22486) TaxID=269482 RepID=A4JAB2_BURVG|nr:flagellar filament capping protein FliD [Burkholderia vietnamiensis]ABO53215.1 flagellar hook-associated 2 domain protein [Burkholderia vietnamiensis G4]MCB4346251.1 flagellar filament capping protein FliD [Burkholderia vietnamiensis]HDR9165565.1 flagellar filament capping protein FliD [Burkholderia vietnamiensis]
MSTVSGSSTASTIANTAAATTAQTNAALQQAAQSIISGSTGNSSMDVNSLVTALVNAKTAGQAAALTAQQTTDNTTISAYGTLSAGLSALQAGLKSLSNGTTLNAFTATASGNGITAAAASGAVAGSYSIDVSQVATAQVLTSKGYSATTALASGPSALSLSVGGASTTISLDGSNSTIAGIASAINSASNNPGVTATVVNGTDGAHLVLHATATGSSNAISIAVTDSNAGDDLNKLAVQGSAGVALNGVSKATSSQLTANQSSLPQGTVNWTQTTAAQDAYFTIDGTAVTSATNTVTSALSGVTLNLSAASVDSAAGTTNASPQTLTIAQDTTSQAAAINNFVSLYNTLVTTMGTLTSFSSSSKTQGPLLGDSTLNMIQNALASVVANGVKSGGTTSSLGAIGISLQADGTLSVDSTTLNSALESNQATVAKLFNSTNGIAAQLNSDIAGYLGTNGPIQTRTNTLNRDLTSISTQQAALSTYQAQLTNMYQAQFTALNTLMSTMNNNSQYLTQLFGGTNSQGAMSANKG